MGTGVSLFLLEGPDTNNFISRLILFNNLYFVT